MNSLKKRKITAAVVSLILVVAVVTTGILCAPFLHKSLPEGDVSTESVAYTDYNMQKVEYNISTTAATDDKIDVAVVGAKNGSNADRVWVLFPKEIYLDKEEDLSTAGYYYNYIGYYGSGDKYREIIIPTAMGWYSNETATLSGTTTDNMGALFSNYSADFSFPNGGGTVKYGDNWETNQGNVSVLTNPTYGDYGEWYLYAAMKGKPGTNVTPNKYTYTRRTGQLTFLGQKKGTFSWSTNFEVKNFDADCAATNPNNYFYGADANSHASLFGANSNFLVNKESDISISVTIYDKSGLLQARKNLENSIKELSSTSLATSDSITAANALVTQANTLLAKRKTNQSEIDDLKNRMNSFVFDVTRPSTTPAGWTYDAVGHKGKTDLENVWSAYNGDLAKYFNVHIHNDVYDEFNSSRVLEIEDRNVNRKDTVGTNGGYTDFGYLLNAGTYTITVTPKEAIDDSGITHVIRWATNPEDNDSVMTLTIARGTATGVDPNTDGEYGRRVYDGSAKEFSMLMEDGIVEFLGTGYNEIDYSAVKVQLTKEVEAMSYVGSELWGESNVDRNTISFTEVGKHTIYYRIQAKNHGAITGSYQVEIAKGNVIITFGARSIVKNADNGVLTYGDALLSSEQIISQGVTSVSVNGSTNNARINKDTLSNILTIGLLQDGTILTEDTVADAGSHGVRINSNGYKNVTQTADERDESIANGTVISTWNERLNFSIAETGQATACYIERKGISFNWNGNGTQAEQIYDGLDGHRPSKEYITVSGAIAATAVTYNISVDDNGYIIIDDVRYDAPLNEGSHAVWAGTYNARAVLTGDAAKNYKIVENETYEFTIQRREVNVKMRDLTIPYAYVVGEPLGRDSSRASEFLAFYQVDMFQSAANGEDADYGRIFEYLNGTSVAFASKESRIFEVDIVDVPMTKDDLDYCAGVYVGALVARVRTAVDGAVDYDGEPLEAERIRSHNCSFESGTLTITPATIGSDRRYMRKTFNGEYQDFALNPQLLTLKGTEAEEVESGDYSYVTFEYSLSLTDFESTKTNNPIQLRNHDGGKTTTIYYRVTVPNHETTEILNFEASILELSIDVKVKDQQVVYYYGDAIPDHNALIDALGLEYSIIQNELVTDGDDLGKSNFVLEENLRYYIARNGEEVTDHKSGAGNYSLGLKPLDETSNELDNYNITYSGRGNASVFTISQRPLVINWAQSGGSWQDNGMKYVYDTQIVKIHPVVLNYRLPLSNYNSSSSGDTTQNDNPNGDLEVNVVDGDTIVLAELELDDEIVGKYTTDAASLTNPVNMRNYRLLNPRGNFEIVKREVEINVFDREAEYGSASSIVLGALVDANDAKANWEYHSDSNDRIEFVGDHYTYWMLSSTAQQQQPGKYYRNVGNYDIVMSIINSANARAIADNYNVIVYTKHTDGTVEATPITQPEEAGINWNVANFEITEAELSLASREFNFDADSEDCVVTLQDIINGIRVIGDSAEEIAAEKASLTVTMSTPYEYRNGAPSGTVKPSDFTSAGDRIQIANDDNNAGRYYIWVSIVGGNYRNIDVWVDINYLTNWISIKLGSPINVNYGDNVYSSTNLFRYLNFVSISGVMAEDNSGYEDDVETAKALIKSRGYFTLFVDKGDRTALTVNEKVGSYSVYMNVNGTPTDNEGNELNFRFVGEGNGLPSNVDVYKVIPRPVYLIWNDNIDETYGDHTYDSASHIGYRVMNVLADDDVDVTIIYMPDADSTEPGKMLGEHVHEVGYYIARLTAVDNANYRVATIGDSFTGTSGRFTIEDEDDEHLVTQFRINPRNITVTIKNQTLVYGSLDARKESDETSNNNVYNLVNRSTSYEITNGSLYRGDRAAQVFTMDIDYSALTEGRNYLPVRDSGYQITGKALNKNYTVTFVREGNPSVRTGLLTITNAEFTIDSMAYRTISFDGLYHMPIDYTNGDELKYTFAGDAQWNQNRREVWFNADVNAQAGDPGWEKARDTVNGLKFRNAGEHIFAVMVEAPNHNPQIRRNMTFEILPVNVRIDITGQATKVYGDVIGNGTKKDVSDFIKNPASGATITYTVTKNPSAAIANQEQWAKIKDIAINALTFYVVAGGSSGADGGSDIADGNFANNVGEYRIYHEFAKGEAGNYIVDYAQVGGDGCNAKAYKITPRPVDVYWYKDATLASGNATLLNCKWDENGEVVLGEIVQDEFEYSPASEGGIGLRAGYKAIRYNEQLGGIEIYYVSLLVGGQGTDVRDAAYMANASFNPQSTTLSSNYTLNRSTTSFAHKIVPKKVKVTVKTQSIEFGEKRQDIRIDREIGTAWEVIGDDTIINANLTFTLDLGNYAADDVVDVNDYAIKVTCGNRNYSVTFFNEEGVEGAGIFKVTPAEIDGVPENMNDLKYNGGWQDVDIFKHIDEHLTGDGEGIILAGGMEWNKTTAQVLYKNESGQYVEKITQVKDMGTTQVEYRIIVKNHKPYDGVMNVTVSKARIVFNADVMYIQYGSTTPSSAELFEKMNIRVNKELSDPLAIELKDLISVSIRDNDHVVGEYRLRVTVLNGAGEFVDVVNEFSQNNLEDLTQTGYPYHIVPRELTVDWGQTKFEYNATEQYFQAVGFGNTVNDDEITHATYSVVDEDGNESTPKGRNAGEYLVKIVVNKDNVNYVVTEENSYQIFTIYKKEVEIEWIEKSFTYDGLGHMLQATIVGGVFESDVKPGSNFGIGIIYCPDVTSAGTHIASVVELDNENYTVSASATKEFRIEPKEVEITWDLSEITEYNGKVQNPKASVKESSLIPGDTCGVVVSGGGKDAGTHRAVISRLTNSNYKLPAGGAGQEYVIAPRVIKSVSWGSTSLTYLENYGIAQEQAPSVTALDGMVDGETVEFDIVGKGANAGSYTAFIMGVKGGNYMLSSDVTNTSVNYTIAKATNSFNSEIKLPAADGGLPALADFEDVSAKYGKATIKYYTDAECQNEYTGDIDAAPKGTYYVVVSVEGNANYSDLSTQAFAVEVEGKSNVGLIVGIVVPVAVVVIVGIVLAIVLSKKKKGQKA